LSSRVEREEGRSSRRRFIAKGKTGPMLARERRSQLEGLAIAVIGPSLITLLAIPDRRLSTTTVALLYVLAVAVAAGLGGPLAGVAASLLSFLALNFFFTPPLDTFLVGKTEDLAALIVFLLVSVITGLLLSKAVKEKTRAETREQHTQLMNRFTARLLSGRPLEEELCRLTQSLTSLLGLAACTVETIVTNPVKTATGASQGDSFKIELRAKNETFGRLSATPPASRRRLNATEIAVVESVAGQLALAIESTRLTTAVQAAQVEAETNRLRAALFSGVTHDLKTPLSAITASVTSLLEGSTFSDEQRYEHLDTIRQEAEHLNRVVTNLMDLARLRAGALVPDRSPAAIDELIEAVVARLQPSLDDRDVQLHMRDDLPEMAIDVVQIDQVLTNLVENAAKFSPSGTPIEIKASGNTNLVRVTVSDRGPGIAKDDRERVFQPFERGNGEVSGTGLGLAIARAAVVAHGGRMWAQEGPNGGAAVTFELPTSGRAQR
jgi:two-component system, OmpR family, sensor histidine kinase KdpD